MHVASLFRAAVWHGYFFFRFGVIGGRLGFFMMR